MATGLVPIGQCYLPVGVRSGKVNVGEIYSTREILQSSYSVAVMSMCFNVAGRFPAGFVRKQNPQDLVWYN